MITEQEYSLGGDCPAKLQHLRDGLPRNDQDNSFAQWTRMEAGKLKAVSRHLFPQAIDHGAEAVRLLQAGNCTAANVSLATGAARCHVDFIVCDDDVLRLYQVVPKCVDLDQYHRGLEFTTQTGRLRKEWRNHMELMAFRVWVARQVFPNWRVVPLFVTPIRGAVVKVEGVHAGFEKTDDGLRLHDSSFIAAATELLRFIGVAEHCEPLVKSVPQKVAVLEATLQSNLAPVIGYRCKKCEFKAGSHGGFARCWGPLAEVTPHMFDLGYMYFIQDQNGRPVADRLAREGRVSLYDIPPDRIAGEYAPRQRMEIEGTRTQEELIDPDLAIALERVRYPLHFLDIETLRSILPAHRGGKVNGLTLFQFSVHRRDEPNGALHHREWLNQERGDPNSRFLSALRAVLGEEGSVVVYTDYERASFAEMLADLIGAGEENDDMRWLRRLIAGDRIFDLHRLTFDHYWHPRMRGRTSIKVLLPAVWSEDSPIKACPPYDAFPADIDPYEHLKNLGQVSDGCLAMIAYLDLHSKDETIRQRAAKDLLEYCMVDTLAMSFVFDYFEWAMAELLATEQGVQSTASAA